MFPLEGGRRPLLLHAEDLERQAEALERQPASAARPGLAEQRQAEQQPQEAPPPRRKPG